MNEESSALIVEIAKAFFTCLESNYPDWTKGYFRFTLEPGCYGSKASYTDEDAVFLIDPFADGPFFKQANELGRELIESCDRKAGLLLLIADKTFDYEVKFEWDDLNKWQISKLNGNTGIPVGL